MGRGRAKAKQVKVARQLKYNGGGTDLNRLRQELGVGTEAQSADPTTTRMPSTTTRTLSTTTPVTRRRRRRRLVAFALAHCDALSKQRVVPVVVSAA